MTKLKGNCNSNYRPTLHMIINLTVYANATSISFSAWLFNH